MKKRGLLLTCFLCLALLTACSGEGKSYCPPAPEDSPTPSIQPVGGQTAEVACRIVDGAEEGNLLLAELDGTGVYRLAVTDEIPLSLDGAAAAAADLADGMELTVTFDGMIQESYPGGFYEVYALAASAPAGGSYYDLCGFYLKVLDDLWNVDGGLNGSTVGIDLSQAPGGLSESEKAAVAWRFGELHGVDLVTGTFDELLEEGYITAEPLGGDAPEGAAFYQWEGGCLLSVVPHETGEDEVYSLPVLRFDAEKWASSLGAYFFYDCTAVWPEFGTWTDYAVGAEMIS